MGCRLARGASAGKYQSEIVVTGRRDKCGDGLQDRPASATGGSGNQAEPEYKHCKQAQAGSTPHPEKAETIDISQSTR